jgi:hypothetical protein
MCLQCSERAKGRTAQADSSSFLNEYSCSIFFRVPSPHCVEAGTMEKNQEFLCFQSDFSSGSALAQAGAEGELQTPEQSTGEGKGR